MVYIRTTNEVLVGEKLEFKGDFYMLDGKHMIETGCVLKRCSRLIDALDQIITVGTDEDGMRLKPVLTEPSSLKGYISRRKKGLYYDPFEIYGAILTRGKHNEPIIKTVCEFDMDGKERML